MVNLTIIIQEPPYVENNKAWHALRFAGAALAEDMQVRVHLLDDGVKLGVCNHNVPEGKTNLEELLIELMDYALEVRACGMSVDDCSITESELIEGIEKGSMKSLAAWVKSSDHVMTF